MAMMVDDDGDDEDDSGGYGGGGGKSDNVTTVTGTVALGLAAVAVAKATMMTTSSMPSHFDRWKAWSQLVLRVNQYNGASDSHKKNFAIWSKNGKIGPHHDSLYCAQMAQTLNVVLRRCLPLRRSRDPQLIKGR